MYVFIYIYIYLFIYLFIYLYDVYLTIELLIAVVHSKLVGILQQWAPPFERSMS